MLCCCCVISQTVLGSQLRVYLQPPRKLRGKQSSASASTSEQPATSPSSTPLATYSTNIAFLLASANKDTVPPAGADITKLRPLAAAEMLVQQLNESGVQCTVTAPGYINFNLPATVAQPTTRRKSSSSASASPASSTAAPALPPRQLTVTQVPATYTREAFEVFEKYQRAIHNEGTSPSRYKKYATLPLHNTAHD